jgi:iron complex transport system ATP-binding protein
MGATIKRHAAVPLLEFKNITVLKGTNKKVLDTISITIHDGENIAILGPNGSGKSSFIKTITREYYPVSTENDMVCKIWGADTWNISKLRSSLGIVSNDLLYLCTRDISVMELLLSGFFSSIGLYRMRVTGAMRKKGEDTLEFLEITHLRDKKMTEISSGEARRVLIGRALVHDPKALILDEPTNSLDLHALFKFRNVLRKIAHAGTSIIMVTHNVQDIIPEISRVVLVKDGRFFKDGAKEQVLTTSNMKSLFSVTLQVKKKNGFYYCLG